MEFISSKEMIICKINVCLLSETKINETFPNA